MKRAWMGAMSLLLVALAATPATLAREGGKRPMREGMARMADELGLTTDQRTQMRAIAEKYREGPLGDHMQNLRQARMELRKTIHDVKATDAQVQEAARAVASHSGFVAVERHRMAIEMDRVLTDEQRQKAAELRQRRGSPDHEGDDAP